MKKVIFISIIYSVLLLLLATLFVTFFEPLHLPFIGDVTVHHQVIAFFYSGNTSLLEQTTMTSSEISHMVDVRNLLLIALVLVIVFMATILFFWKKLSIKEQQVITYAPFGFFLTIIVPALLADFSRTFYIFHELLFPQGNYTFPFKSVLIQTYSAQYFALMGLFIVVIYLVLAIIFAKKKL